MARTKKDIKKELKEMTDTIDVNVVNQVLDKNSEIDFKLTKQTLQNIAKWALDGKSQFEIAQNLELTKKEWGYLLKICPTILLVMQHSHAYAETVIIGSLYQTAVGGHTIRKKVPMKVRDFEDGKVVGEHIEMVEYDEVQPSNPYLLKWIAENKLGENFGKNKADNSIEHRNVIDAMTEEELKVLENYGVK